MKKSKRKIPLLKIENELEIEAELETDPEEEFDTDVNEIVMLTSDGYYIIGDKNNRNFW